MADKDEQYSIVANILQRDCYALQMKGRTKPLKVFIPCRKGLALTSGIGDKQRVSSYIIPLAARTPCSCHPQITENELWELWLGARNMI